MGPPPCLALCSANHSGVASSHVNTVRTKAAFGRSFTDADEAARAYDAAARDDARSWGDVPAVNFPAAGETKAAPTKKYTQAPTGTRQPGASRSAVAATVAAAAPPKGRKATRNNSRKGTSEPLPVSRFTGVTSRFGKWEVKISHKKKWHPLGTFADEEEAARAFDTEAVRLRGPGREVNFPTGGRPGRKPALSKEAAAAWRAAKRPSSYRGVHWHTSGWGARIKVGGSSVHLGIFDDEQEAAQAYDDEALAHMPPGKRPKRMNFPERCPVPL